MAGTAFSAANWGGYDEQSATNPGSALTDFSLLIDVSTFSATWKSSVQSDAGDIRCTKGDGSTELAYDLINWAYNAGAPTGHIRVKWSGTLAASGTQEVRVYASYTPGTAVVYDASETYGSDNAYDGSWETYHPFDVDPTDRTSSGNDLTDHGTTLYGNTGQVDGAIGYDDASNEWSDTSTAPVTGFPVSISAWIELDQLPTDAGDEMCIAVIRKAGTSIFEWLVKGRIDDSSSQNRLQVIVRTSAGLDNDFTSNEISVDTLHHIWLRATASIIEAWLDDDDANKASTAHSRAPSGIDLMEVGRDLDGGGDYFGGFIDDLQVHSADRHVDWKTEEYDQSSNQATFWGTWAWTATAGGTSPKGVFGLAIHGPLTRAVYP